MVWPKPIGNPKLGLRAGPGPWFSEKVKTNMSGTELEGTNGNRGGQGSSEAWRQETERPPRANVPLNQPWQWGSTWVTRRERHRTFKTLVVTDGFGLLSHLTLHETCWQVSLPEPTWWIVIESKRRKKRSKGPEQSTAGKPTHAKWQFPVLWTTLQARPEREGPRGFSVPPLLFLCFWPLCAQPDCTYYNLGQSDAIPVAVSPIQGSFFKMVGSAGGISSEFTALGISQDTVFFPMN